MKKALFIINPHSGVDRVKALRKAIEDNLDLQLFQYEIVYTEYAKHGTVLAKEGVARGFDLIVAVGGDGSVNDVINGLYGTEGVLGIIPKGSGNGLARSLGIPLKPATSIRLFNNWVVRKIDIGEADGHLFASNVGVGFDTVVTDKFRKSKHRGLRAYMALIIKNVLRYPVKEWELMIDGKPERCKAFMLTAANAVQLGYGFRIAPQAKLEDGLFDLVSIGKFPKVMAATIAIRAFRGAISKSPYVTIRSAKEIIIAHKDLTLLQFDGEAVPCNNRIIIKMLPQKLKVIAPVNF